MEKSKEKVKGKEAEKSNLERKHRAESSNSAKKFESELDKEKQARERRRLISDAS